MAMRRILCVVALVAATVTATLVAAPVAQAKVLNGCLVITPEELEGIFEQRFATGTNLTGDYCQFNKRPEDDVDNILVQILVTRSKTEAKAEKEFERLVTTTTELAGEPSDVKGIGDEAISSYFLGVDTLTVRQGRVIARIRIDNPDSDDAYGLQTVAVAEAALPRLQNLDEQGKKK